ncbi:MAG: DUF1616 domain-containing protein, partial [Thermoproteus sp.]
AYRLLIQAAEAGANVTGLADMFNEALAGGQLGPDFGALAARLTAEAERARAASLAVLAAALVAAGVLAFLLYKYRRTIAGWIWLAVWRRGFLRPGSGRARTLLFDEEVAAVVAAVAVVLLAFVAALELRPAVAEPFSAIGLLGPGGKIGGYPSEVSAGQPIRLYIFLYNHMGRPVWYVVEVKVDNGTVPPPLPSPPVLTIQRLLLEGQNWTAPLTISFNRTGRWRLVAELWEVYPNGTTAYTGQYVQLWLNVTGAPR